MIIVTIKDSNHKLPLALLGKENIDIIEETDRLFFSDITVSVTIQTSRTNIYSGIKGTADILKNKIMVYSKGNPDLFSSVQCLTHELGHIYHAHKEWSDFIVCTDFGRELYAENFSEMVLGSKYNLDYITKFSVYRGYNQRKKYNFSTKDIARSKIKPYKK